MTKYSGQDKELHFGGAMRAGQSRSTLQVERQLRADVDCQQRSAALITGGLKIVIESELEDLFDWQVPSRNDVLSVKDIVLGERNDI